MVKRQNRVNDPASNAPRPSGGNRTESFTDAPGWPGALGKQPGVNAMETEIVNGTWKGHLGRGLAPRELQFLLWVALGLTAKEIAREVGISPAAVAKRLSNAMFKLGVTRRAALVAEAIRRQIISPMCVVLVALIAMHALPDGDSMRRDRRVPERRIAHVRTAKRAEAYDYHA